MADDAAAAAGLDAVIDTTVSHSARIWNYWLGGKDNFAADREAGDRVAAMLPSIVAQARADPATANRLSVRIELQADCFAGVWGHHTAERGLINQQDVATALQTASQIGDDYLQRRARGTVAPETFTHGSAAARQRWFTVGMQSGDPAACDTFRAEP